MKTRYIRDRSKIRSILVSKEGMVKVTKDCKVYIPKRYTERNMLSVGEEVSAVGIFGITIEDKYYSLFMMNSRVTLSPTSINVVTIEDTEYYEFSFDAGSTFITTTSVVKDKQLVYNIFDEIVAKGNSPWYLTYKDLGLLFDSALKYGGLNLRTDHAILEMISAIRGRLANDRTGYFRHELKSIKGYEAEIAIIPLRSVMYGATNTVAKLNGADINEGISSALVNPTTRNEDIEDLLRR